MPGMMHPQGSYIGRVGTLMTDLPKGQIVHVVVGTDAMSGVRNRVIRKRHGNDHGIELGEGHVGQQECPTLWTTNSRF
jgi:sporulation protein YlmC with PRC-barrel domain